jgi:hypothetical protein
MEGVEREESLGGGMSCTGPVVGCRGEGAVDEAWELSAVISGLAPACELVWLLAVEELGSFGLVQLSVEVLLGVMG